MSHSRWVGALLVLLAVAGSIVVGSRLRAGVIAGIPKPVAIGGEPVVGDCVAAVDRQDEPTELSNGVAVPSARMSSCADPHVGEVVSVTSSGTMFPIAGSGGFIHYQASFCSSAAQSFVGLSPSDIGSTEPWTLIGEGVAGVIGPADRQRQAGQNWVACIAFARWGSYRGTIRNSLAQPIGRAGFALCETAASADAGLVSCDRPHRLEVFGTIFTFLASAHGLETACMNLISRTTGITDPTRKGLLAVTVRSSPIEGADDRDVAVVSDQEPGTTAVECGAAVAGTTLLTKSLVGVGNAPLPWE